MVSLFSFTLISFSSQIFKLNKLIKKKEIAENYLFHSCFVIHIQLAITFNTIINVVLANRCSVLIFIQVFQVIRSACRLIGAAC